MFFSFLLFALEIHIGLKLNEHGCRVSSSNWFSTQLSTKSRVFLNSFCNSTQFGPTGNIYYLCRVFNWPQKCLLLHYVQIAPHRWGNLYPLVYSIRSLLCIWHYSSSLLISLYILPGAFLCILNKTLWFISCLSFSAINKGNKLP